MKQTLQLKLGQQLSMTPQLQQAIKLLQLSALELNLEIQTALESNPMLEYEDGPSSGEENPEASSNTSEESSDSSEPEDLPAETSWEDLYPDQASSPSKSTSENTDFESWHTTEETLQDHLLWQLYLTPFTPRDLLIADAIIEAISDEGYLQTTLEELKSGFDATLNIELDEMEVVLHRIQQFDPLSVGARDLKECLLVQLSAWPPETPYLEQARYLVQHHLDLLAQKNYTRLKSRLKLTDAALQAIIDILTSLNPKPGNQITSNRSEYIIPDVFTMKKNGRWIVQLNKEHVPKLRINAGYSSLVKRADTSRDNKFLQEQLTEARWFLKSLQNRNETLLKVACCIVDAQKDFLEQGPESMKPLVLQDVAKIVELHESTISRITTQKYMHTPRGIFELKYFFSSHVQSGTGEAYSSTAIKALLKSLIDAENRQKPLSDHQLVEALAEKNIAVARRTIAKYRESMGIPPSNRRKELDGLK